MTMGSFASTSRGSRTSSSPPPRGASTRSAACCQSSPANPTETLSRICGTQTRTSARCLRPWRSLLISWNSWPRCRRSARTTRLGMWRWSHTMTSLRSLPSRSRISSTPPTRPSDPISATSRTRLRSLRPPRTSTFRSLAPSWRTTAMSWPRPLWTFAFTRKTR